MSLREAKGSRSQARTLNLELFSHDHARTRKDSQCVRKMLTHEMVEQYARQYNCWHLGCLTFLYVTLANRISV